MNRYNIRTDGGPCFNHVYESVEQDGIYVKYTDMLDMIKYLSNHSYIDAKATNVILEYLTENTNETT